ncbi:MAG: nuclear transport factor 2 family protein [Opitutaceae bacterium]|nr:nuclear transport factor 2 family protein [Opitutaceae bacterium]
MKALIRLAFVYIVIAAGGSAAAWSADVQGVEAEILRMEATRVDTLLKGDLKGLEQLYADDLVYIHANGRVDTKRGYLAMLAGGMTYVSLRYAPPARITVAGRDTAIVTGRASIEMKNKAGQVTKRVLTTTTVYMRSASGWRVISYQGTPVQP